jgi:thioredoxin reductase (NADPH)
MVRSILLRGFDQQMANLIGDDMEHTHGTRFIRSVRPLNSRLQIPFLCRASPLLLALCPVLQCTPSSIVKQPDGRLAVTYKNAESGEIKEEVFDTVLTATGRYADTGKLGLDRAGVVVDAE